MKALNSIANHAFANFTDEQKKDYTYLRDRFENADIEPFLYLNISDMSVINETSQELISLYIKSAFALSFTHISTAVWSSSLVWGWKTSSVNKSIIIDSKSEGMPLVMLS